MRLVRPAIERLVPKRQYRFLLRIGSNVHNQNLSRAPLAPDVRRSVISKYFREDISKLQRLIQRDLSAWPD
jgi:hypothetical protein